MFLNGEYWGIYNIRERYNEEYINTHYGVSEENVWIIDGGHAKAGGSAAQEAYDYFVEVYEEQLLLNHQRFFNEGYGKKELEEDFAFIDDFFARRLEFVEQAIEEVESEEIRQ